VKGRIDLSRFVALTASNNAKLYGLHPKKGTIAVGADADLALWDPEKRVVIRSDNLHSNCGYTPYEGMEVQGWPELVMSRGEVVVKDGALLGAPGRGRFLEQGASSAWGSGDKIKSWV
jgi:dihydropyrimidinase